MSGPPFRHEDWLVQVLDQFDVRRDVTPRVAERIVEVAQAQLGLDALRTWLPSELRPDTPEGLRDVLARSLVDGTLRLVRLARAHEPLLSPQVHDLVDLIEASDEDLPRPPWVEVTCLGPRGETYAFNRCRVQLPDGSERYARLDHRSRVRIDDVPDEGVCHFELSADARPDGGRRAPEAKAVVYEFGTAAAVSTSAAHVLQVSSARPWIEIEVVDTRGRPVSHLQGTLHVAGGERSVDFDRAALHRSEELPDSVPVGLILRSAGAT